MSEEPKDQRIPIMMSASEVKAIDDWAFENRIRTRAEAVRRLVQIGIIGRRAIPKYMEAIMDGLEVMENSIKEFRSSLQTRQIDNISEHIMKMEYSSLRVLRQISTMVVKDFHDTLVIARVSDFDKSLELIEETEKKLMSIEKGTPEYMIAVASMLRELAGDDPTPTD